MFEPLEQPREVMQHWYECKICDYTTDPVNDLDDLEEPEHCPDCKCLQFELVSDYVEVL